MASSNLRYETSDSDNDDAAFLADIQAISDACLHPDSGGQTPAGTTNTNSDSFPADLSDSDEDLQLLRDVQSKYGGANPPPALTLPVVNSDSGEQTPAGATTTKFDSFHADLSDPDEDFQLLREVERKYGSVNPPAAPLALPVVNSGDQTTIDFDSFRADLSESDDDLQLLREVQRKYGGVNPPAVNSDPDSDDCSDFELLRTVQIQLGQYSAPGTSSGGGKSSDSALNIVLSSDNDVDKQTSRKTELPKCALAFIDAIRKNRLAQKHIKNQMVSIEARILKVKEIIKRLKIVYEYDVQQRKKIAGLKQDDRLQLIAVRNSGKKTGPAELKYGPEENSRVVNYRIAFEKYSQSITKEKWTKNDRRNLQYGLTQQVIMSNIGIAGVNPQMIRSFLPYVDWEYLASTYLPKRSGRECQARWVNVDDPLINNEEWTKSEDIKMLHHLESMGFDWIAVAESLGTNRTPYQCLTRYQRSLNPALIKREWTREEDIELTKAVEAYGESNWAVVASRIEGRTGPQCSNRWMKALLPSKQKKGRWSAEEDKRLKIAVTIMGSECWNKIAEFVPGRTQARCRDRWVNNLDPRLNLGRWTRDEDSKLEEAIRVYGYSWAKVATCVVPRTDSQCRRRWRVLFPDDVVKEKAKREVAKVVLPCYFVDREQHRSDLGAEDFSPSVVGNAQLREPYMVSETVFSNFPKKHRSKRCRRR